MHSSSINLLISNFGNFLFMIINFLILLFVFIIIFKCEQTLCIPSTTKNGHCNIKQIQNDDNILKLKYYSNPPLKKKIPIRKRQTSRLQFNNKTHPCVDNTYMKSFKVTMNQINICPNFCQLF